MVDANKITRYGPTKWATSGAKAMAATATIALIGSICCVLVIARLFSNVVAHTALSVSSCDNAVIVSVVR